MDTKQQNTEFFSKQFYKAIKEQNLERKTNKELGAIFGVSAMTFNKWINGKMMPAMARIPHIAKTLGVSVEYLVAGSVDINQFDDDDKNFINKYKNLSIKKKQIVGDIVDVFSQEKG